MMQPRRALVQCSTSDPKHERAAPISQGANLPRSRDRQLPEYVCSDDRSPLVGLIDGLNADHKRNPSLALPARQKKLADAEPLLKEGYEGMKGREKTRRKRHQGSRGVGPLWEVGSFRRWARRGGPEPGASSPHQTFHPPARGNDLI